VVERRREALLIPDCFDEPADDFRIRVGNEVFEELGHGHGRLITSLRCKTLSN
jgi:hypothetical protein